MSDDFSQLKTVLKTSGKSLTGPRKAVFATLRLEQPLTVNGLIARCSPADRASVYRTISLFEQLGIIQRLQMGWKYKLELSDAFQSHHHHLTCLNCSRVITISEDNELELRLQELARSKYFVIKGHQLEVQGLCLQCQNKI